MKLRLQSNSIRLRLKQGEVDQLAKTGRVEEKIIMGIGPVETFDYTLESSPALSTPRAILKEKGIVVQLPIETVARWATGDDVGIEARLPMGARGFLHLLIEKDFACLTGPEEQNVDTFPNPLAGTKC